MELKDYRKMEDAGTMTGCDQVNQTPQTPSQLGTQNDRGAYQPPQMYPPMPQQHFGQYSPQMNSNYVNPSPQFVPAGIPNGAIHK